MDQTLLLALVAALVVALVALARITTRRPPESEATGESSIAVSTEGMKICPKCGMGNLWTERRCSSCASTLKG